LFTDNVSCLKCALALRFPCESHLHSNQRRKQDAYQETTIPTASQQAAMREHQGDDLEEH
jgi:hypothetical protein